MPEGPPPRGPAAAAGPRGLVDAPRTGGCADALGWVRQADALVRRALAAAPPERLTPEEARHMASALGRLHKLVAASALRCSQHAGRDAAAVLARAQGSSVGKAKAGLSVLDGVAASPSVERAFRDGAVSLDQLAVIAPAVRVSPGAAGPLLEAARSASITELREEAARTLRRTRGEASQEALERKLHERRSCRLSFPEGGGVRLQAFFGPVQGARVRAALERATGDRVRRRPATRAGGARGSGGVPIERLRADALADLVAGLGGRPSPGRAAGPQFLVRVDAAALRRGSVDGDEVCEIAGVGPVSVASARSLLGDGFFTVLVQDGVDIRTVTSTRRAVPRRVRMALMLRDQTCVVPGCGAAERLEIDHWRIDYSWSGPTELDNLCRLCPLHHSMKTEQGWQLLGGPGRWRWAPPEPVTVLAARRAPRERAERRRPAAARGPGGRGAHAPEGLAPSGKDASGSRAPSGGSRQTGARPRTGPPGAGPSAWRPP